MKLFFSLLFSVALLSGCATQKPSIYYWGEYEPLLLKEHKAPGSLSVNEKIELLNNDIIKAQGQGKKIAPGFYAYLGYLYFQEGDEVAAKQAFSRETELFPESSHFINGILERRKSKEAVK